MVLPDRPMINPDAQFDTSNFNATCVSINVVLASCGEETFGIWDDDGCSGDARLKELAESLSRLSAFIEGVGDRGDESLVTIFELGTRFLSSTASADRAE